jgi:hypothetical protein
VSAPCGDRLGWPAVAPVGPTGAVTGTDIDADARAALDRWLTVAGPNLRRHVACVRGSTTVYYRIDNRE